jgi:hypothetical protein
VVRLALAASLVLAVAGCPAPRPAVPRPAPAPEPGLRVQKVREDLQVTPLEAVFSGVRGEGEAEESVAIKNTGSAPVQLSAVEVVGDDAAAFKINAQPTLPITLIPSAQVAVAVAFAPGKDSKPGVHRAMLKVLLGPSREEGPPVDLSGLVLTGRYGDKEPPLGQILETLGFAVEVGAGLRLGTAPEPLGEEVAVPRFQRARKSPVSLYPVARFAANERLPYGYYKGEGAPEPHPLGAVAGDQDQKLNPELEPDAVTTFDPGEGSFGLFVNLGKRYSYTEDRMNTGVVRHAARIYPLKSRLGARIPDAYAVAFESGGDGDYQDLVFVIWNVKPASAD